MRNKWLALAAIYVALLVLSIGITAGLVQIVCWAFGLTFMWRYAIGIWALLFLFGGVFKGGHRS